MKKLLLILLCLPLLFSSCKDVSLSIGQTHQGGIIFYLDGNGGGLIVAPSDQSNERAVWGWEGKSITGADGNSIGTGQQNTIDILAADHSKRYGLNIAAKLCDDYTVIHNGITYDDWFLPSKDELTEINRNIEIINTRLTLQHSLSHFSTYWSSTEFSENEAWSSSGNSETLHPRWKGYVAVFGGPGYSVRAIRAF